ncbi:hypothetical protein I4U23_007335 [Adineta vaga]|nr:hypothetical protein I4U23_007335 [Adineta vaga]
MYPNTSRQSYREQHRRQHTTSCSQPLIDYVSMVSERKYTVKLRRRRAQAALSFYDNNETDEQEPILSKWTVVRQRLPDILALSNTYKPTSVRAQLVLLVALMNKQTIGILSESIEQMSNGQNKTISHIVPSSVILDISGRSRLIFLKSIPSEQLIHVDIDNLSFSIPTRQFILAISRGHAHETAAKYCPPAISDMLIELSKTKVSQDNAQYQRAQFKMRLGQIFFFFGFIFIISMMLALIIAATKIFFRTNSNQWRETHSYSNESFQMAVNGS